MFSDCRFRQCKCRKRTRAADERAGDGYTCGAVGELGAEWLAGVSGAALPLRTREDSGLELARGDPALLENDDARVTATSLRLTDRTPSATHSATCRAMLLGSPRGDRSWGKRLQVQKTRGGGGGNRDSNSVTPHPTLLSSSLTLGAAQSLSGYRCSVQYGTITRNNQKQREPSATRTGWPVFERC